MVRKRKSRRRSKASGGSCSVLKARISKATTKTSRGKALGAYAKAGCIRKKRRSRKR